MVNVGATSNDTVSTKESINTDITTTTMVEQQHDKEREQQQQRSETKITTHQQRATGGVKVG